MLCSEYARATARHAPRFWDALDPEMFKPKWTSFGRHSRIAATLRDQAPQLSYRLSEAYQSRRLCDHRSSRRLER